LPAPRWRGGPAVRRAGRGTATPRRRRPGSVAASPRSWKPHPVGPGTAGDDAQAVAGTCRPAQAATHGPERVDHLRSLVSGRASRHLGRRAAAGDPGAWPLAVTDPATPAAPGLELADAAGAAPRSTR